MTNNTLAERVREVIAVTLFQHRWQVSKIEDANWHRIDDVVTIQEETAQRLLDIFLGKLNDIDAFYAEDYELALDDLQKEIKQVRDSLSIKKVEFSNGSSIEFKEISEKDRVLSSNAMYTLIKN